MNKSYWMYGKHAVIAALNNSERRIHEGVFSNDAMEHLTKLGIKVKCRSTNEFQKINDLRGATHQGYAIRVNSLENPDIEEIYSEEENDIIIALDQVTDPQNIGAIIRSGAAFGVHKIIMQRANAPEETGSMAKAAAGTLEMAQICYVANIAQTFKAMKRHGYWIAGLDGTAQSHIKEAKKLNKIVLVLGAEGEGLRRLTVENCDLLVKIPMAAGVESLNVSNAAAISLYELSGV